jgi:hypothetical protein
MEEVQNGYGKGYKQKEKKVKKRMKEIKKLAKDKGEQQYCRKCLFAKLSKISLGQNAEFFS